MCNYSYLIGAFFYTFYEKKLGSGSKWMELETDYKAESRTDCTESLAPKSKKIEDMSNLASFKVLIFFLSLVI